MDIKKLIAVATGEIDHTNNGLCPDRIEGFDSRDPGCPACKILTKAAAEHDAMVRRLREAEATTAAARDVLAERRRQIEAEGWTLDRDDEYTRFELARAGACYAEYGNWPAHSEIPPNSWPWSAAWWKPTSYRQNLVKAAALILAEIERLDRIQPPKGKG